MGKRLRRAEAQAGRLADEVARLQASLQAQADVRNTAFEVALGDLRRPAVGKLIIITPNGKTVRGVIVGLEENTDQIQAGVTSSVLVPGRRSVELRVALTP